MSLGLKPELLKKYPLQGPRYTSYPTAPEFKQGFSARQLLRHIQDSNSALLPRSLAIYLHIPFCHSLCYYCGCHKVVTRNTQQAQEYLSHLYQEIELLAPHLAQDRLVTQIHFGGGTPNFLNIAQFREVLDTLARAFHLSYPENLEISMEVDPRYMDEKQVAELVALGINRISIGVQDYDPQVQAAINRIQSREQVDRVINAARDNGIKSVAVDLIAGLPAQTQASFMDTLRQVVDSGVDRIAVYNFAFLPQQIRAQKLIDPNLIPDNTTRFAITQDTIDYLIEQGYVHIGMDHFALPDDPLAKALESNQLRRSFQGYTTHADCDQIGLGVSAISQIGEAYSQNVVSLENYYSLLDQGQLPVERGISLTQDDRIRAHFIQKIMCQLEVDFVAVGQRFGINCAQYFADELAQMTGFIEDGLVQLTEDKLTITTAGRFFLRNIAMVFDRYLADAKPGQGKVIRFPGKL